MSESTSSRIGDSTQESIDKITREANKAKKRLEDAASDMGDDIKHSVKKAGQASEEALDTVGSYVREHPLITLGVAFTAGLVAYSIFRR